MSEKYWMKRWAAAVVCLGMVGCVQRTLTVRTDPPGALIYLNDQEVGRTPFTRNFIWYGTYDVEIRKEGYQSIKTTAFIVAPWWQWVPMDFFAEFLPLTDHHALDYTLRFPNERHTETDLLVKRGEAMQGDLESSRVPQTQPTTKPHKHAKPPQTRPATTEAS